MVSTGNQAGAVDHWSATKKTRAQRISADGVSTIYVTIDGTTHELNPDDAAILALQVKNEIPTVLTVDGDLFTIEFGYDAMSCGVEQVIEALVKAGRIRADAEFCEGGSDGTGGSTG